MPDAAGYFQVFSVGLFYNIGSSLFQAVGNNRRPLYYLILAVVLNIALDLLFVAGGVRGAALATVIAQGCAAGGEFFVLLRTRELYRLRLDQMKIDWAQIGDIIRCALPSSLQNCVVSLSNVVVQSHVNQFGQLAMAGFGAYNKLGSFAVLPAVSTSLTLTTFTSQNLGAGNQERAGQGVWYGMALISGVTLFFSVIITGFAPWLIRLFNPDPAVISYGVAISRRVAPFLVLLGLSRALTGALRAAGRAKTPMLVLLLTWCLARVAWIGMFSSIWHDIRVVYWGYPITWVMSSDGSST